MRFALVLSAALVFSPFSSAQICGPDQNYNNCPDCSPILINFAEGDIQLTGSSSPVFFDLAATGVSMHVGWTAAGTDEAFLCLDRNGDGTIDSGAELFGSVTPLKDGSRAGNGFVALAEFDDNHDGLIDAKDAIWPRLILWRDLNHDGVSQSSELTRLADSNVIAIDLNYHWARRTDRWGNIFRYQSTVWITSSRREATPRSLYDIFFVRVP